MTLRLAAFAALSVRLGIVSGCAGGGSGRSCDDYNACELGVEFCNYENGDSGVCEGCGDGCDCGLPQGGEEDCDLMCEGSAGVDGFGFGDEECPWPVVGFLAIFVGSGVAMVSGAAVNNKLTSERFKFHQVQGTEVPARCIKRWTTISSSRDGDGHSSTTTHYHNTFVYCVPMPTPTPTAQYLLITKDFETGHGDWAHEGAMVQINHLLSATGDARNATLVSEMSARKLLSSSYTKLPSSFFLPAKLNRSCETRACADHEGTRHCCTLATMAFGCVFTLFPLVITVAVMDCGAKVLSYVLLILGCPVCMYTCGRRTQAKKLANPDGMLEQVDEAGKQMAMTGPIGAKQNCAPAYVLSCVLACHALAHYTKAFLTTTSTYCRTWICTLACPLRRVRI